MTEHWQEAEQQKKAAGQVSLDTRANLRSALAGGIVEFCKSCGVTLPDTAHTKIVKLLEDIGAP